MKRNSSDYDGGIGKSEYIYGTGKFKKFDELSKIFQLKGITKDSCVLNYCGGGIAASLEAFVLYQLGFENITIYDNSLHEWAAIDQTLPMENN